VNAAEQIRDDGGDYVRGRRDLKPLMSSADQTWNTPDWFIERLRSALGPIGLDPCSNEWSVVNAATEFRFDHGQDGLALPWRGHGLTFVNSPFGRALFAWADKWSSDGDEVVALEPSRTDTAWWQLAVTRCAAYVQWRGRFEFRLRTGKRGNAPFPSTVFYYGSRTDAFLAEFARSGHAVRMPERRPR